ncbi:MAG: PrsW family intramembrane metalloprotease [Candidatus Staskawiczbacteria bacterium]|nr:PrsW family intramembrane metalloprotease [Candidatus Staskawiczbacteria bacterium]MBI3337627.1 PrsW family intramembrane metalloprotease [Candidatus Staskawiczbacteria bacterium]
MIAIYQIFLYIFFGILPSLIWLFYYLRKDDHPEPKLMILKIFLFGSLATLPVFVVQFGLSTLLAGLGLPISITLILYWFLAIALTEEFFKYLVVKAGALKNKNLDEPLDIMIYMITAALGFAALENILYLFPAVSNLSFRQVLSNTIIVSFVRFIGATFLHTLASGALGYLLIVEVYEMKKRGWFFFSGLVLASASHGLYNFSITTFDGAFQIAVPITILAGLAIFVFWAFNRVKTIKSVVEI